MLVLTSPQTPLRPRTAGKQSETAIQQVRNNLYVIPGAGGNTTVFVTAGGVVLVDTKLPNNGGEKSYTHPTAADLLSNDVRPDAPGTGAGG